MNNHQASAEIAQDEPLLDQLVQDLFLSMLRRELAEQKTILQDNGDALFRLNNSVTTHISRLNGAVEGVSETLAEQARELEEAKEEAQGQYRGLQKDVARGSTERNALHTLLMQRLSDDGQQQARQLLAQHEALLLAVAGVAENQRALQAMLVEQDQKQAQRWQNVEARLQREEENGRRWRDRGIGLLLLNTVLFISAGAFLLYRYYQ